MMRSTAAHASTATNVTGPSRGRRPMGPGVIRPAGPGVDRPVGPVVDGLVGPATWPAAELPAAGLPPALAADPWVGDPEVPGGGASGSGKAPPWGGGASGSGEGDDQALRAGEEEAEAVWEVGSAPAAAAVRGVTEAGRGGRWLGRWLGCCGSNGQRLASVICSVSYR